MDDDKQPNVLEFLGVDPKALAEVIDNAVKLEDNAAVFEQLASISKAKGLVESALEAVEGVERDAKSLINTKATALYGPDWQVIKGEGYKIGRSLTGAVYELSDPEKVDDEFVKIEMKPNAKNIDNYRETHDNSLPDGVSLNERRGESIRITVKNE